MYLLVDRAEKIFIYIHIYVKADLPVEFISINYYCVYVYIASISWARARRNQVEMMINGALCI